MQRFQILVGQISQKTHAKLATLYRFPDLTNSSVFKSERERSRAVDLEIDGSCASSISGRPERQNGHGFDGEEQVLTVGAAGGDAEGA